MSEPRSFADILQKAIKDFERTWFSQTMAETVVRIHDQEVAAAVVKDREALGEWIYRALRFCVVVDACTPAEKAMFQRCLVAVQTATKNYPGAR